MARTNYSYEKRQQELKKKKKREEKLKRKQDKKLGKEDGMLDPDSEQMEVSEDESDSVITAENGDSEDTLES